MTAKNQISQTELRRTIASRTGCSAATAKSTVDQILDDMRFTLLRGASVRLNGVGVLRLLERKASTGRNPRTGEPIEIMPGHKLQARLARELKDQALERPSQAA